MLLGEGFEKVDHEGLARLGDLFGGGCMETIDDVAEFEVVFMESGVGFVGQFLAGMEEFL